MARFQVPHEDVPADNPAALYNSQTRGTGRFARARTGAVPRVRGWGVSRRGPRARACVSGKRRSNIMDRVRLSLRAALARRRPLSQNSLAPRGSGDSAQSRLARSAARNRATAQDPALQGNENEGGSESETTARTKAKRRRERRRNEGETKARTKAKRRRERRRERRRNECETKARRRPNESET